MPPMIISVHNAGWMCPDDTGTGYAIGLRDPHHHDSHLDLYDAHYTSRNLWWIADAQPA